MNIVVCVKQVADINTVELDLATNSINSERLVHMVNPYDMLCAAEAVRIKEKNAGSQVIVITVGTQSAKKALRKCLALGADRAILLCDPAFDGADSYFTAVALSKAISLLQYDIVFCGIRAMDTNLGQVGPMIAEILDILLVSGVTKVDISADQKRVTAQRRLDKGNREVIETTMPVLLTGEVGLNQPRYPSLPSVIEAQRKDIEQWDSKQIGLSAEELRLKGSKAHAFILSLPKPRPKKIFVPDSTLSAAERMRLIMSGGITEKKADLLEGDPKEIASTFAKLLKQKNLGPWAKGP